jgi:hypothetical protein
VRVIVTCYEVINVLEGACLLSISIDSDGLIGQRLGHKVADNPPVIQRHLGAVRVEDAHDANLLEGKYTACQRQPQVAVISSSMCQARDVGNVSTTQVCGVFNFHRKGHHLLLPTSKLLPMSRPSQQHQVPTVLKGYKHLTTYAQCRVE